jgi:hypothetical protein
MGASRLYIQRSSCSLSMQKHHGRGRCRVEQARMRLQTQMLEWVSRQIYPCARALARASYITHGISRSTLRGLAGGWMGAERKMMHHEVAGIELGPLCEWAIPLGDWGHRKGVLEASVFVGKVRTTNHGVCLCFILDEGRQCGVGSGDHFSGQSLALSPGRVCIFPSVLP